MNRPSQQRVALITGGNSGVGLMTARGLAKLGWRVIIACRSPVKANHAVTYLSQVTGNPHAEYFPLDLASFDSVSRCVELLASKGLSLDLLINNGGIFARRGITKDGFELTWGTNYLGHFWLTYLLLEKSLLCNSSRIVMIASDLALQAKPIDWWRLRRETPVNFLPFYNFSKLCLLSLTQQLSERGVSVNSIHPGFVQSNITLGHRLSKYLGLGISPEVSAQGIIDLATSSSWERGKFFNYQGKEMPFSPLASDAAFGKQLWNQSLNWCTNSQTQDIYGPYSLSLSAEAITEVTQIILKDVLPFKPPKKKLSLFKGQLGSIFLSLVEHSKQQFNMERHLDSPVVRSLCDDPNLLETLKAYLGPDLVLWRSELWVNEVSKRLIPLWHRDCYHKLIATAGKTVHVYIALTEVNAQNGFEYIPKDKITEDLPVKMRDPFSGNPFFELPSELEKHAVPVVLKPGEFILFTDELIHRSLVNNSDRLRLSLTLRFGQGDLKLLSNYSSHRAELVYLL